MTVVGEPTVRIAVVGAGRIGTMHAELLAQRVQGADVAAVVDRVPEVAAEVGQRLGVPVAPSTEAVLADDSIDAVAVCTSTDTHAALARQVARAGKALFCEKPVSLDLPEVERTVAEVESAGIVNQVGFNRRFDPAHAAVAEAVRQGRVGDLHLVRISSRDPAPPPLAYVRRSGGLFLDMTIHDFDMARFVVGREVEEVSAWGQVRVHPAIGEAGDVDTAVLVLRHEDRCLTTIDNSRQAAYGFDQRVEAFGSAGMAASGNPLAHTAVVHTAEGTQAPPLPWFFHDRYVPSYLRQWAAFIAAVQTGEPSPVPLAEGAPALMLGLAASRSARECRTVRVDEVVPANMGACLE